MLTLFSFWDPHNVNVGVFNVVPEVSFAVFFFFFFHVLFSIFCFVAVRATILFSRPITSSSACYLLLIPSAVLFMSGCSLVILGLW